MFLFFLAVTRVISFGYGWNDPSSPEEAIKKIEATIDSTKQFVEVKDIKLIHPTSERGNPFAGYLIYEVIDR